VNRGGGDVGETVTVGHTKTHGPRREGREDYTLSGLLERVALASEVAGGGLVVAGQRGYLR